MRNVYRRTAEKPKTSDIFMPVANSQIQLVGWIQCSNAKEMGLFVDDVSGFKCTLGGHLHDIDFDFKNSMYNIRGFEEGIYQLILIDHDVDIELFANIQEFDEIEPVAKLPD